MEKDENQDYKTEVECTKCKKTIEVQVVQVVRSEKIPCPNCKTTVDLMLFNTEAEKSTLKNQKELDKLKKLLG